MKNVFCGKISGSIRYKDGEIFERNEDFLTEVFSEMNVKMLRKKDIVEKLKLISYRNDGTLLLRMLDYRNKI